MTPAASVSKGKWMQALPAWMRENTIDFQWGHGAKFNAQAHKWDQVLMNINVNLMKEVKKIKEQSKGRKSQRKRCVRDQGPVVKLVLLFFCLFKH